MIRHWEFAGLLVAAGLAAWLLLAGADDVLGFDAGHAGMFLLISSAWMALYRVARMPRSELESAISPGEWRGWVGFGFCLVAVVYFLAEVRVLGSGSAWGNPEARAVGGKLVLLLIAWTVLSSIMASRWKDAVQEDERDLEIVARASGWGRTALVFSVIGLAVMLGLSPAERLQWATPFMLANLLVFALLWSCLCEYAATVAMYWRDRR